MRVPTGLPSASRLDLAMACVGSVVLEVVDQRLEAGDVGHNLHAELDTARNGGEASAWASKALEAAPVWLPQAESEVTYSLDAKTGEVRREGSHLARRYGDSTQRFWGTADYVATDGMGADMAHVVDLKTGLLDMPHLWQLRFGAIGVHSEARSALVRVGTLHAPRDERRPWLEWGETYDALDVAGFIGELKLLAWRIGKGREDVKAGSVPRLTTGKHCEWCPARLRCPAQVELVKRWAGKTDEAARDIEALLDVDTAGEAWRRIEAADAVLKSARRQLYAFGAQHPFPLGDGRMFGRHRQRGRDVVDAQRAFRALAERFGSDEALKAVTLETSKSKVWDFVAEKAPHGEKRKAADAFVAEMRATGVIAEKWKDDVGPYDPRDESIQSAPSALPAVPAGRPLPAGAPVLSPPGDNAAKETAPWVEKFAE